MNNPPRATTQISLYHENHLVTRGAGVPIEKYSYDEQVCGMAGGLVFGECATCERI